MNHIDFIKKNTNIKSSDFLPEIKFYGADNFMRLWEECEKYAAKPNTPPPYWGFPWAGSLALGRYIFKNSELVKNKSILDFACGSGLAGIAALKCGARSVEFNDIDEISVAIAHMNCNLNDVEAEFDFTNLVGKLEIEADLIFAGDIFYEQEPASDIISWLEKLAEMGKKIIVANPGRKYGPELNVVELVRYDVLTSTEIEDSRIRETIIYQIKRT